MEGMTLKQWGRTRYLEVCDELRRLRCDPILFNEHKQTFILLSLRAHSLKQYVPKTWYKLSNQ